MKKIIGVILSALLFGLVAGGMMVGVNYIAQERNIYSILRDSGVENPEAMLSSPSVIPETEKSTQASENTVIASSQGSEKTVAEVAKEAMPSVVAITNMMRYQQNGLGYWLL